jgi:hypothetical protein
MNDLRETRLTVLRASSDAKFSVRILVSIAAWMKSPAFRRLAPSPVSHDQQWCSLITLL